MNKEKFERYFDYLVVLCIIITIGILIMEYTITITPAIENIIFIVDSIIIIIFLADLYIDYRYLEDKKKFLKHYWPDILALIPFYSAFRILKVMKLLRLFRVSSVTAEEILKVIKLRHTVHSKRIK
ncbi:ion transporter [Candidatus Woesearchaeota archaeon]|nr:ion transporter [Candidatus Woesearchaeota archaeon]